MTNKRKDIIKEQTEKISSWYIDSHTAKEWNERHHICNYRTRSCWDIVLSFKNNAVRATTSQQLQWIT